MIAGAIIAGGGAKRLGGTDKCLLKIGDSSILERAIAILSPHTRPIVLNANGDPSRFSGYKVTVVPDDPPHDRGPLGGVLSIMNWNARYQAGATHVATIPGDMPFLPKTLVPRLIEAGASNDQIAVAVTNDRVHPLCALWPLSLRGDLEAWLCKSDNRRVTDWLARHETRAVQFPDAGDFVNINTPKDLDDAIRIRGSSTTSK
jgi:molybdopterin-guanine dinucleotide biosynthesis protein A